MKPFPEEERKYECVQTEEAAACMICLDCEAQAREYPMLCKVSEKKDLFHFCVESTGVLPPEMIVLRAIEVLRRKLHEVSIGLRAASNRMDED